MYFALIKHFLSRLYINPKKSQAQNAFTHFELTFLHI
jgi:hypothetical protein